LPKQLLLEQGNRSKEYFQKRTWVKKKIEADILQRSWLRAQEEGGGAPVAEKDNQESGGILFLRCRFFASSKNIPVGILRTSKEDFNTLSKSLTVILYRYMYGNTDSQFQQLF